MDALAREGAIGAPRTSAPRHAGRQELLRQGIPAESPTPGQDFRESTPPHIIVRTTATRPRLSRPEAAGSRHSSTGMRLSMALGRRETRHPNVPHRLPRATWSPASTTSPQTPRRKGPDWSAPPNHASRETIQHHSPSVDRSIILRSSFVHLIEPTDTSFLFRQNSGEFRITIRLRDANRPFPNAQF